MPWPMRFGPPPRIMIFLRSVALGLVFAFVGRIEIGRVRLELGAAGIDGLNTGLDAHAALRASSDLGFAAVQ